MRVQLRKRIEYGLCDGYIVVVHHRIDMRSAGSQILHQEREPPRTRIESPAERERGFDLEFLPQPPVEQDFVLELGIEDRVAAAHVLGKGNLGQQGVRKTLGAGPP